MGACPPAVGGVAGTGRRDPEGERPMRRAVLCPLILALALATAVALLAAAAALGDARVESPPSGRVTEAAVRRFYAAANAAILTGDAALEAAVGPGLVDHDPPPGVAPDRAGLARYLAALHATAPGVELVVEDIVAAGDRALAWVTVRGADRGAFLGLPLAVGRPLWGALDAWRVADGRVIERWGAAAPLALLEPLGRVALDAGPADRQVVDLERLAIPPGGRLEAWRPAEARMLYLEAGALAVAVASDSPGPALLVTAMGDGAGRPTAVGPGSSVGLGVGDLLALPPRTAHALRNDAAAPAAVLALTVSRAGAAAAATGRCDAPPSGVPPSCSSDAGAAPAVAARPLAGGRTTMLPAGPRAAAVGRATLAPGAELASAGAVPVLLYVEAGTLALDAGGGDAWVRRGGTGVSGEVAAGVLGAGDGALLRPGAAATQRNAGDGPLVVLVVTIAPAP